MLAFVLVCEMETVKVTLSVSGNDFIVRANHILEPGWKKYQRISKPQNEENEDTIQEIENIDWSNLVFKHVSALEKKTKPPKYYNEALLLAFMENPKGSEDQKLKGIGTAAYNIKNTIDRQKLDYKSCH